MTTRIRLLLLYFSAIILSMIPSAVSAVVYEASTLHNAVSRADTVQGLFYKRWDKIVEESLYLDLYCRINWLDGFQVKAYNRGTGEYQATDMTLVRTYGSITITYPIFTESYLDEIKNRFSLDRESKVTPEEEGAGISKYWDKDSILVGFTTTGFHYGLTRETTVDRGTAGEETVTDYKFSQFFDDIYALSILYVPYAYVHGGIVVNNQIEPNDDGTIDYGDSSNKKTRYFFASNILSFLNANATVAQRELEVLSFSLNINKSIKPLYEVPLLVPALTIGYKRILLYRDAPWDAVWVTSYYINDISNLKDSWMSDKNKDEARLTLYTALLEENYKNIFLASYYMEFQRTDKTLVDKRTREKIDIRPVKDVNVQLGINLLGLTDTKTQTFTISGGWSMFWDPAVAVHRESGSGYNVNGWIFKIEYNMPLGGAHFMINRNYSEELRRLIEATDKLAIEGSLFFKI